MDAYLKRMDKNTRLRLGRAQQEPVWRRGTTLNHAKLPADTVDWLYDAASLTKRLKQASSGRFQVRILSQVWQRPMRCERQLLGLGDRQFALVRQVYLLCDEQVVVFARTVLPGPLLKSRYRYLARLGGKPLGEVLFRDKSMRRSEVQLTQILPEHEIFSLVMRGSAESSVSLWGRRSLFQLGGQPLLVSEVFVPPLPKLAQMQFRVTRKSGR